MLYEFEKVEVIKGTYGFEVNSWSIRNLPYFNSSQDSSNEVEQRGLVYKKENLMNYIFGQLNFKKWW